MVLYHIEEFANAYYRAQDPIYSERPGRNTNPIEFAVAYPHGQAFATFSCACGRKYYADPWHSTLRCPFCYGRLRNLKEVRYLTRVAYQKEHLGLSESCYDKSGSDTVKVEVYHFAHFEVLVSEPYRRFDLAKPIVKTDLVSVQVSPWDMCSHSQCCCPHCGNIYYLTPEHENFNDSEYRCEYCGNKTYISAYVTIASVPYGKEHALGC